MCEGDAWKSKRVRETNEETRQREEKWTMRKKMMQDGRGGSKRSKRARRGEARKGETRGGRQGELRRGRERRRRRGGGEEEGEKEEKKEKRRAGGGNHRIVWRQPSHLLGPSASLL
eukprot:237863-Hanusia_phi.AAC.2